MKYDYYLQNDKTEGVRRFPIDSDIGQRWDRENKKWDDHCCDRRSCELTKDIKLTEEEIQKYLS